MGSFWLSFFKPPLLQLRFPELYPHRQSPIFLLNVLYHIVAHQHLTYAHYSLQWPSIIHSYTVDHFFFFSFPPRNIIFPYISYHFHGIILGLVNRNRNRNRNRKRKKEIVDRGVYKLQEDYMAEGGGSHF